MNQIPHATLKIEIDSGPDGPDAGHVHLAEGIQQLFAGSGHWSVWKVRQSDKTFVVTDVVVSEQEQPTSGKRIWEWNAGDVEKAAWDAMTAGLPNNLKGKKQGSNSHSVAINEDMRLYVPHRYQVPEMLADGRISCDRRTPGKLNGNPHCQFAPRKGGNDSPYWTHSFFRIPNHTYRDEFTIDFAQGGTTNFDDVSAVLVDYHPGTFTKWKAGVSRTPPISLYIIDGQFQLHARGDTGVAAPSDNEYDTETTRVTWPFAPGTHKFAIEWRVNHGGTGVGIRDGHVKVWMDDDLKADATTPIGIDGGGALPGALFVKFGAYEYSPSQSGKLALAFENLSIDVVDA